MSNVAVVGLGYVGLTLSILASKKGYKVFGIDTNSEILDQLSIDKSHFYEKDIDALIQSVSGNSFFFGKEFGDFEDINFSYIIITVGTPISDNKKLNLEDILSAIDAIKPIYDGTQLVILRSTVSVGTTRKVVLPYLSKMVNINEDKILLCFCPERTIEGNALDELSELPQIIGSLNSNSYNAAENFFRKITPTILSVESLEAAELVKLFNNAYRDIEFSIGNYFNRIAQSFGINGVSLIKTANYLYPRSKIALPGLVGGPCLEKDSYILVHEMPDNKGKDFVLGARNHNESIDIYICDWILNHLEDCSIKKIGLTGMAFKGTPDTSDLRGSPSLNILKIMKKRGIKNIRVHDYLVSQDELTQIGDSYESMDDFLKDLDILVILTNNRRYKTLTSKYLESKLSKSSIILDIWGVLDLGSENSIQITTLGNMFLKLDKFS